MSKRDLPVAPPRQGSGQPVRRIEDHALVTGNGRYTDDASHPDQLHVAFLRSPYAHALLKNVDVLDARASAGVVEVLTGASLAAAGVKPIPSLVPFKRPDGTPGASPPRRALAHERVRYVGEAVAAVIATSHAAAVSALDAIFVDYEELPAVVDPASAMRLGATPLCEQAPDNVCAVARYGKVDAVREAFSKAAHVVSLDLVNQRVAACPIEPRAQVAYVDPADGRLMIFIGSQTPTGVRDGLVATIPGLTADQVRVTVGDIGGGFGVKAGLHPESVVVAYAAWTLKRPVKWRSLRLDEFLAGPHGRDLQSHAELALDAEGKVLALRSVSHANLGAYVAGVGAMLHLMFGPWVSNSIYDIPLIDLEQFAVLTNTAPVGAYRGAGRPEAIFIIERLLDAAARQMRIDPAEIRRRNMIRPEQMPYTTATGMVYDVGEFRRILDAGLELADWSGFEGRRAAAATRGRLRGRGIATFLEWTGGGTLMEKATVSIKSNGTIEVVSATQAMGQGIATCYAQLAVDVFDVPIESIRIVQGDTDRANGMGSVGSRSLFTGGAAVKAVSELALQRARELAAETLEAPVDDISYGAGRFSVTGKDSSIGLFELAARQPGGGFDVEGKANADGASWPNACHVCEIEIDPDTGSVEVVAYASVNDIGRIVNPVIARGQVEGGAAQGIGQALFEQVVYDAGSAQLQTASLMDYALPRSDIFRDYKTVFDTSIPCKTNVLGTKGVGELGTIGATPAVVSAVNDALNRIGLGDEAERLQMPLTAPKVWALLQRQGRV